MSRVRDMWCALAAALSAVALARVRLHGTSPQISRDHESRVTREVRLLAADHIRTEVQA